MYMLDLLVDIQHFMEKRKVERAVVQWSQVQALIWSVKRRFISFRGFSVLF